MQPFTLVIPHQMADATEAAAQPGAMLKAGGTDLLDRLKERVATPSHVVNLLALGKELGGVQQDGGALRIGALCTLRELVDSFGADPGPFGAIRDAAADTATPNIRNRATVGGNLLQQARCWYLRSAAFGCLHGRKGPACLAVTGENRYHSIMGYHDCVRVHPSNLAPALLAFDCDVRVQSGNETVTRKLSEVYPKEPKALAEEHTLAPGEILTAVLVAPQPAGTRSCYRESREKLSFDWATTAAAVRVVMDGGVIRDASIVLGAVAPVPMPMPKAARLLAGQKPSRELFKKVADAAFAGAAPLAQNAYKVQVGKAVLTEALLEVTK